MKKNIFLVTMFALISGVVTAQVGLGTITPDASALLDVYSTTKGLLVPRMNTKQRDLIVSPAKGLLFFNTDTNSLEINSGTALTKTWTGISNGLPSSNHNSISETGLIATSATTDVVIPGMVLTPARGIYSVFFNSEFNNDKIAVNSTTYPVIGTAQCVLDLQSAYEELMAIPVTDATHAPAMGTGETIFPGIYSFSAAASIAGTLILDAKGDSNAVFIFKSVGAFAVAAATTIVLANGAESRNVFWVSGGSPSIGAASIFKGTMLAQAGAGSIGAGCDVQGRMFSIAGALTFGPSITKVPPGVSPINLRSISNFAFFTSNGGVSNTAASTITGNIGTNLGAVIGLETSTIKGFVYTPDTPIAVLPLVTTTTFTDNNNKVEASFSIYQNNVLIPSSVKTLISTSAPANISLQAIATVAPGETIEVRWKTGSDRVAVGNRILTVIKVQ